MESDGPDDPIIPMKKSLSLVVSGKGLCSWSLILDILCILEVCLQYAVR